jgi:putative nucleotidyltransferase with HDIG domain
MLNETMRAAKILIVGDQEANVLALERLLEREGYAHFKSLRDPRQVIGFCVEFQPDLILLDLARPYLDGFAILEELRSAIPAESYLPVLVLTADLSPEARQRALVSGANDFLAQPFDGAEVLLRIRNLLEMRLLYRQLQAQNQTLEERVRQRTAQLAEAEAQSNRRADEFAALYDLTYDLTSQRDLPSLLDAVLERAIKLFGVSGGFLYLYDAARGDLELAVAKGVPIATGMRLKLGEGVAGRTAQMRQSLVVEDHRNWEGRAPQYAHLPITSVAQAPLLFGGELIGVLGINEIAPTIRRFTEADTTLLTLFAGSAASAVHAARSLDETRRAAARAQALARTAARLNARLDLETVLKTVCEETAQALNVSATTVTLYDEQRKALAIVADFGLPQVYRERATPTPRALYDEYARQMGPLIVVPDMQAQPGLPDPDLYAALDMRTVASASMLRGEQLVGALALITFGEVRHFTEDELTLLQGLADQAAQAITNARLLAETERHVQRLSALRSIDQAITSSLDLNFTLKIFLEQVAARLSVDAADVLLFNPHLHTLDYAAGRGFRTSALQYTRLRLGEGYAGRAALERRTIGVPDWAEEEPDFSRAPLLEKEGFQAYYGVPLIAKGQIEGVLEIFHRAPLDPDAEWLDFLEALAGQAAIAIDNSRLFNDLQHSNLQLILAYDATIEGWSHALDLRDKETEGHTQRVTEMTLRLARALGVVEDEMVHFRRGALLHDIGKMGIPDAILLKPDKLTDEEWDIMRQHPTLAHELLSPITFLRRALDIPYCHHERWDGTGYPRGLKGEQIPLAARIFAVVDVWDALRSDRPYRAGWPPEKVLAHLRELAGIHFEPRIVNVFLQILREG